MEHMWAPWRMEFILTEKPSDCILCQKPAESDDEGNLILHRGRLNFVILNKFPYNPGHLMVAPYRHIATLEDMTDDELMDHFSIVRRCTTVVRGVFEPAGFNIGINLGKIAGAGIDRHAHTHIVPRWSGDTNFMPVVADTRVLPEGLASTYAKLKGMI
jgi:ATP adenylyltransferase